MKFHRLIWKQGKEAFFPEEDLIRDKSLHSDISSHAHRLWLLQKQQPLDS